MYCKTCGNQITGSMECALCKPTKTSFYLSSTTKTFPMQDGPNLPWNIAEKIYKVYVDLYGDGQSMERMADAAVR